MKTKATKDAKGTEETKVAKGKKAKVKKSKFVLAWEKFEPNRFEVVDMRAILK